MTDQTVPDVTDDDRKLAREWAEFIESDVTGLSSRRKRAAARVILDAVPALPTLADMTPEERGACRWMQADVTNRRVRYVIADPCDEEGDAALASADGGIEWFSPWRVTPRPDLPRMEWPGTEKPAPALPGDWRLADHKDHGRVIVTTQTPGSDGYVYVVLPVDDPMGYDWHFINPDDLTYIDQGNDTDDTRKETND